MSEQVSESAKHLVTIAFLLDALAVAFRRTGNKIMADDLEGKAADIRTLSTQCITAVDKYVKGEYARNQAVWGSMIGKLAAQGDSDGE